MAQKEDKICVRKASGNDAGLMDPGHRPPLQRLWADICCCILMQKPVEKILIRYERMPQVQNRISINVLYRDLGWHRTPFGPYWLIVTH